MEGEGGGMMEGEGGGMMEGEGGGWCGRGMEGEHWNSLTCAHRRIHPSSSVGGRCVRGRLSFVGDRCHPGVGRRPRALEGCAGGGARRPLWFHCDGLGVVVGIRVGGGVVAARGRLSFMGPWVNRWWWSSSSGGGRHG